MRFTSHKPRRAGQYPRPAPNSRLADLWEWAILTTCCVGAAAIIVVAHDRATTGTIGSGPPAAQAAIEPAIFTPDPFDNLPRTDEEVAKAKQEAEARFVEMWSPKSKPTTRSTEAINAVDYVKRRHRDRDRDHHHDHDRDHDRGERKF